MTHWRTTLIGALAGGCGGLVALGNVDTLKWWQVVAAFVGAALTALLGYVSADAKGAEK